MQISRKHKFVPPDPVDEGAHLRHLVQCRGLAGAELVREAAIEVAAAAVVPAAGPGRAAVAEAAVALARALEAVGVEAGQHVHVGGVEQADEARVPAAVAGRQLAGQVDQHLARHGLVAVHVAHQLHLRPAGQQRAPRVGPLGQGRRVSVREQRPQAGREAQHPQRPALHRAADAEEAGQAGGARGRRLPQRRAQLLFVIVAVELALGRRGASARRRRGRLRLLDVRRPARAPQQQKAQQQQRREAPRPPRRPRVPAARHLPAAPLTPAPFPQLRHH